MASGRVAKNVSSTSAKRDDEEAPNSDRRLASRGWRGFQVVTRIIMSRVALGLACKRPAGSSSCFHEAILAPEPTNVPPGSHRPATREQARHRANRSLSNTEPPIIARMRSHANLLRSGCPDEACRRITLRGLPSAAQDSARSQESPDRAWRPGLRHVNPMDSGQELLGSPRGLATRTTSWSPLPEH